MHRLLPINHHVWNAIIFIHNIFLIGGRITDVHMQALIASMFALLAVTALLLMWSSFVARSDVGIVENISPIRRGYLARVNVIDLEGSVTIGQTALEVKHAISVAIFSTPLSTKKTHDWPKSWMVDILAGVVETFYESSVGIVGDTSHHLHHLIFIVIKARSLNKAVGFNKGSLVRRAGHVAVVLAEVVPTGWTSGGEEGADPSKVRLQVPQLSCAAAKVHL